MCVSCEEVKLEVLHNVSLTHPQTKHQHCKRIRNLTVQRHCAKQTEQIIYLQDMKNDPRTAYELYLRKRVSDNHWQSVKRTLIQAGMDINDETVVFFAKLRKEIPRASVGILEVLQCYQKAEKLLAINSSKINGSRILEILQGEGINPHAATISRWFKPLGGFRKTRLYYPEKLTRVITSAFIYKIANSTKLGA